MAGLHGGCQRWWGTHILRDLHRQVLLTELLLLGPDTCQLAACFKHLSAGIPAGLLFSCRTLSCCLSPSFPGRGWLCAPAPGPWTNTWTRFRLLSSSVASQGRCQKVPPPPLLEAPSSSQCPVATPAAPTAPHSAAGRCWLSPGHRARAATRVGGDGARLLMCNWHRHLSPAREERGRGGSGARAAARLGPGRCRLRGRRVGTRWRP